MDEVKEHRYVFERICEAEWLIDNDSITKAFKDVCRKVKFSHWDAVKDSYMTPSSIAVEVID